MPTAPPATDPVTTASTETPSSPEAPAATAAPAAAHAEPTAGHDFRSPASLSVAQMRVLRLRQEEFARSLATRLSIYLRLEVSVQAGRIYTSRYRKWLASLPVPTYLTLFHIETLEGTALLECPPRLAMTLIDRLLGGAGSVTDAARDLTEIEIALTDDIVQLILREWCPQVVGKPEAKPHLAGHENNASFLQTTANETNLLILGVEVKLNECTETFTLALPLPMFAPIVERLTPHAEVKRSTPVVVTKPMPRWNPELDQIKVALTAGWDGFEVPARRLADLRVGDLLPIDPDSVNQVQVRLAQILKFTGRLGTSGKARAVELTAAIRS